MLNRFTERARRVVVLAIEEARSRSHEAVCPEHVLMGILREGNGLAFKVLERFQVSVEALRAEVERALDEMPGSVTTTERAFSPEARAVLEASVDEQRRHRHNLIGTEHLLLGLLTHDSAAGRILCAAGVNLDEARGMTQRYLGDLRVPYGQGMLGDAERRRFNAGDVIFREGAEPHDEAYIVYSGLVDIYRTIDGERRVLETLREGALFGEVALLRRSPRSAEAVAQTDVELLILKHEQLESLIRSYPGVMMNVMSKWRVQV
jgi:hypothetical protein